MDSSSSGNVLLSLANERFALLSNESLPFQQKTNVERRAPCSQEKNHDLEILKRFESNVKTNGLNLSTKIDSLEKVVNALCHVVLRECTDELYFQANERIQVDRIDLYHKKCQSHPSIEIEQNRMKSRSQSGIQTCAQSR